MKENTMTSTDYANYFLDAYPQCDNLAAKGFSTDPENIYVAGNFRGGPFDAYQSMESGYLGAQCWNRRVAIKPANPGNKENNPPMTCVWSCYQGAVNPKIKRSVVPG